MLAATRGFNVTKARLSGPKVVYWNNIPSPYTVDRFNALARRRNVSFQAWFNERREPDRRWNIDEREWDFAYRYAPSFGMSKLRMRVPLPLVVRDTPELIVSLYADLTFAVGWLAARQRGIHTAFWAEVTFDEWVVRRSWKESLKRQMFTRVDGVLVCGPQGRCFARSYGADASRVHHIDQGIDVEHFSSSSRLSKSRRTALRERLALRGVTFLYVGRLWRGKGLDDLFTAFREVQRISSREVSLLVVGDGPEETHLRSRCDVENLRNVAFAGFKQKPELPEYYAVADVFVFPSLGDPYGLVVNEAMACALPLISTTSTGEIRDRIEDGVNGFLVPPGDSSSLASRMNTLSGDDALRARMGVRSRVRIDGLTSERWAETFEAAVERILSIPRASCGGRGKETVGVEVQRD